MQATIWVAFASWFNMLYNTLVSCNVHPVHNFNAVRRAAIHVVFGICMLEERVYQQKYMTLYFTTGLTLQLSGVLLLLCYYFSY